MVLDEFQYLLEEAGVASPVVSLLSSEWDSDLRERHLTLVICGSEVGTMQALGRQGALFGRLSREIQLSPFDYLDAAHFCLSSPVESEPSCTACSAGRRPTWRWLTPTTI